MAYKCPGCKGEFVENSVLLDHFSVQRLCAAACQETLQGKLQINLSDLGRIYDGGLYRGVNGVSHEGTKGTKRKAIGRGSSQITRVIHGK